MILSRLLLVGIYNSSCSMKDSNRIQHMKVLGVSSRLGSSCLGVIPGNTLVVVEKAVPTVNRAVCSTKYLYRVSIRKKAILEMSGHGHSHGGCEHDHDHQKEEDRGSAYSLYLKIDLERVQCLNEAEDGSARYIFKPWDQRLDKEKFVESDCDEELLFNIPFTGSVKLKGIVLIGGEEDTHPNKMRIFKNRPNMTFDDTGSEADQEFEVHPDPTGVLEYATKVTRFNQCESVSLHFPSNFGAETSKVYYIGLKGDFTEAHRHEVTICTYEATPNVADHKTNLLENVGHQIH